jgi:hypothetical protein
MTDLNLDNDLDKDKDKPKSYTEEELQKLLQSETDKRVTQAIQTAKAKWEQEFDEKLKHEKTEAEKLAKLTEQERLKLEFDKKMEAFETERKQFLREKLELQTVKELSAIGLPTDFSKFIVAETADEIKTNIDTFKKHWETAIEKAVNEKLSGTTPKTATKKDGTTTVTKEQFRKMSYSEKKAIYDSDKELYESLKG